jgi:hypothetical protein
MRELNRAEEGFCQDEDRGKMNWATLEAISPKNIHEEVARHNLPQKEILVRNSTSPELFWQQLRFSWLWWMTW